MRVISTVACGFKRDGSVLLQKGSNTLEEPLVATERAFVDAMAKAKIVTIVSEQVPDAPVSETRITPAPAAVLPRVNKATAPKTAAPMRRRKATK